MSSAKSVFQTITFQKTEEQKKAEENARIRAEAIRIQQQGLEDQRKEAEEYNKIETLQKTRGRYYILGNTLGDNTVLGGLNSTTSSFKTNKLF